MAHPSEYYCKPWRNTHIRRGRSKLGILCPEVARNRKSGSAAQSTTVQMVITPIAALFCVVFLLVRACVFLDVAVTNASLSAITFSLLEVVPMSMLVFYLHPFRCFRDAGRKSVPSDHEDSSSEQTSAARSSLNTSSEESRQNGLRAYRSDEEEEMGQFTIAMSYTPFSAAKRNSTSPSALTPNGTKSNKAPPSPKKAKSPENAGDKPSNMAPGKIEAEDHSESDSALDSSTTSSTASNESSKTSSSSSS